MFCRKGHAFDFARQGYVNLLTHKLKTSYGKSLFASRRELNRAGFWSPLLDVIARLIAEETAVRPQPILLLDAGCGEGSHLAGLLQHLRQRDRTVCGLGMDTAKDGIRLAAQSYPETAWCVADLARAPLTDHGLDVVLNILSPSNYGEFRRILKRDGRLIKIFPNPDYLVELRAALQGERLRKSGSSAGTKAEELFIRHMREPKRKRVRYELVLDAELLEHLARMTPLVWNVPEEEIRRALGRLNGRITVDLTILCGKNRLDPEDAR